MRDSCVIYKLRFFVVLLFSSYSFRFKQLFINLCSFMAAREMGGHASRPSFFYFFHVFSTSFFWQINFSFARVSSRPALSNQREYEHLRLC